ncbi:tryptophan synthase subunit alpha [bacterium]|nr:tryptophan synthase subunit alpha [bacterium]
MNRIDQRFNELRARGRAAFVPYITAGDPTLARTRQLVLALERAGADVIELGIPFSDPLADGKINQEAAERALKNNVSLGDVIALVRDLRRETQVPLIFFTYLNPVFQYGYERFAAHAAEAGVDGVLALDVPPEEAAPLKQALDARDMRMIFLVAPTSTDERIARIAAMASGFIYHVSLTGVTGERAAIAADLGENIARIRAATALPIAVGFGVSKPEHVAAIAKLADGVVVGSAIVKRVGAGGDSNAMVSGVEQFARELAAPLAKAGTRP